ncbi:hypothetical protein MWU50_03730 [Flavobacteriaceae bacterium S0862]|nr:hypothetical protein [Flavobacteriaceae bacterium S0862]
MKKAKFISIVFLLGAFLSLESCGPVIISSRPSHPTPPWFYPNRVVNVRYVYFPDYTIYYDLTLRKYIYLDNGDWITVNVLPTRFNGINLRRTKQVRVENYYGNDIKEYHSRTRTPIKSRRKS